MGALNSHLIQAVTVLMFSAVDLPKINQISQKNYYKEGQ